jgi:hypothetical protein
MKQKQIYIILGAIGFILLLFWIVVFTLVIKNLRGSNETGESPVVEATLCDEGASDLCIVNFGANSLNRMVIHFQLPSEGYAAFYVKATNRETVSVYTCEVDESVPTNAYCTGLRTPLGETIDLEVYTTDEDKLIARGMFLVSAIAISTPISLPSESPVEEVLPEELPTEEFFTEEVPTEEFATEVPFSEEEPTLLPEGESTPEPVSPNP